jgi:glutathione reductase (NADPH)
MSHYNFDIVIIGGGNAGFGVSQIAQAAGKKIAFVESDEFGGTCPNRGCTPKKVLVAAGQALHDIERAHVHGIDVGAPKLNWSKMIERKESMIGFIPSAMEDTAKSRGEVFKGKARFTSPNSIVVGEDTLVADNFVVATGSKTRPLNIPGFEYLLTSDDVLVDHDQPDSVLFIGGGVIAMEFSHVYARAGTKVTILEVTPRLLPRMDADAVDQVREESERIGISIETGVEVKSVEKHGEQFEVTYILEDSVKRIIVDRVVNGAGRIANVEDLDLDVGGIEHDGIRIVVDGHLKSVSNPRVWVAGDALVGSAQLSPVATREGRLVGRNIVEGCVEKPDFRVLPSAVYTVPALSSVGLTEAEALAAGLDYRVTTVDMSEWFSSRFYAETVAWSKVLVDNKNGQILGAHIVGHHGEELIHLFSLAMNHGISAEKLGNELFAFPTFSADLGSMI